MCLVAADSFVGLTQAPASSRDAKVDNLRVTTGSGSDVDRQRVDVAPSVMRKILDYDVRTDGNPVYVGFNLQTAVVADATWTVYKLFYDASNRLVDQQVAERVVWTARAAAAWRASAGD